jgi:hypothetical protein
MTVLGITVKISVLVKKIELLVVFLSPAAAPKLFQKDGRFQRGLSEGFSPSSAAAQFFGIAQEIKPVKGFPNLLSH